MKAECEGDVYDADPNPYDNFAKEQIPIKILEYLKESCGTVDDIAEEID